MSILEKLKEKREAIKAVEEAKKQKQKPLIEKELQKEAIELAKELEVTFDEALIYVRNEKIKEHKKKIAQERQKQFTAKGKKILRGLEDWGARANQPPITQTHDTKSEIQQETKKPLETKTKDINQPIPTKREKPKDFFEICKEANK